MWLGQRGCGHGHLAGQRCVLEQRAFPCAQARQAVEWAKIGLQLACTRQSAACDTAGLVLKSANTTVRVMCPE